MESQPLWMVFIDFIINTRNLYALVDDAFVNGYTYGLSNLEAITGVVPFLTNLLVKLFGLNPWTLGSAKYSTYLVFGDSPPVGLGTHIVADIFLSFGIVGIILFFILLGYIIEKSKCLSKYSIIYAFIYYELLSESVFMCRGTMFICLKIVVLEIILYYYIIRPLAKRKIAI